jgi:hypothetical protein
MKSLLKFACLALSLLALVPGAAWALRVSMEAEGFGFLSVVDGQPLVTDGPVYNLDWSISPPGKEDKRTTIQCLSTEKWYGWLLTYDPEGKDRRVTLTRGEGGRIGPRWELHKVGRDTYTIRVAEGKLKGWYLDVERQRELRRNDKGERYAAHRLILTENPKQPVRFHLGDVGR